jgi:hypothetical protein
VANQRIIRGGEEGGGPQEIYQEQKGDRNKLLFPRAGDIKSR